MDHEQKPDLTRREVVVGLAATAAAAVTVPVISAPSAPGAEAARAHNAPAPSSRPARHPRPAHKIPAARPAAGPEVRRFLGPVEPGLSLGDGWAVDRIYDVHLGAVSLVLRNGDATAAVDMLRKNSDTDSAPIATSSYTAFYLANRADGGTPTPEGAGLAMMALAKVIEGQERRGAEPPTLLTLEERLASHSLKSWQVPA